MPMILQVLTGKKAGTKFELKTDVVTIGRHPECDIPLDGNSVSRFHAHVIKCPAGYEIEDQKSRNGTIVNGKKIEGRAILADNDRVKICETLFVFRVEPDPADALGNSTAETPAFDDDRPSTVLSSLDAQSASLFSNGVKPEAKLKAIYEVSQAIAQTLDLDMIFDKVLESAFKVFPHADRGIVIEADPTADSSPAPPANGARKTNRFASAERWCKRLSMKRRRSSVPTPRATSDFPSAKVLPTSAFAASCVCPFSASTRDRWARFS